MVIVCSPSEPGWYALFDPVCGARVVERRATLLQRFVANSAPHSTGRDNNQHKHRNSQNDEEQVAVAKCSCCKIGLSLFGPACKLVKFLEIREKIEKFTGDNRTNLDQLNTNTYGRVNPTIDALRISAQIMLNARAIGKLASAQLRQRAWEARQRETTAEVELAA
jgi:hypothetical protein